LFLLPASAIDYSKWFPTDDEGASYDMNVVNVLLTFDLLLTQ
jgi:hypothetical protein